MLPVINCALRKWQTSQKWAFFCCFSFSLSFLGVACRAYHYCRSHPLFPPPVYRETHHRPSAAASGFAFWVVFEHTAVSPHSNAVRTAAEYLWVSFDSSTSARCCFFLCCEHFKDKLECYNVCMWIFFSQVPVEIWNECGNEWLVV